VHRRVGSLNQQSHADRPRDGIQRLIRGPGRL
jgi:hypothetical protein